MPSLRRDDLLWGLLVLGLAAAAGLGLAAAASATTPLLGPGLAGAGLFAWAAWSRPAWGLAGAGLALPLELARLPLPTGALSPAEGAFALVGVLYVVRVVVRPGSVVLPTLGDWPIWLLLLVMAGGIAVAPDPALVVRVTLMWSLFYLVFLQAQSLDVADMPLVVGGLALGTGILGGMGAISYLQAPAVQLYAGGLYTSERAVGTFADANYFASILALVILPAAALTLHAPRRFWWIGAGAAAASAGVVFSLSRGGIIALGGGLLMLLLWNRARIVLAVLVAVFVGLTIADVNPVTRSAQFRTVTERLGTLGSSDLEATNRRPQIWRAAVDAGVEHPVLGVGVRGFKQYASEHLVFEAGSGIENTHNMYLSFFAEHGFPGFFAFLALMAQIAIRAVRGLRIREGSGYSLVLGIGAAMLGFALQGLTQMQLRVNVIIAVFLLLAGFLTALSRPAPSP